MSRSKTKGHETKDATSAETCARMVLEVVPQVMRVLRGEMRTEAEWDLSLPQFRVLAFLSREPGASLSGVADFAGVATATTSATVQRLVRRELVIRENDPRERRRVRLFLSDEGVALLESVRTHIRKRVAKLFIENKSVDLDVITAGVDELSSVFGF